MYEMLPGTYKVKGAVVQGRVDYRYVTRSLHPKKLVQTIRILAISNHVKKRKPNHLVRLIDTHAYNEPFNLSCKASPVR